MTSNTKIYIAGHRGMVGSSIWRKPSGDPPPNPAELLGDDRFEQLLTHLRQQYDYILIDTAPVGPVADATVIATLADATLYVMRQHQTRKEALTHVAELHEKAIFPKLSLVFNATDRKALGYGYGYGYGYGSYSQEPQRAWWKRLFGR